MDLHMILQDWINLIYPFLKQEKLTEEIEIA